MKRIIIVQNIENCSNCFFCDYPQNLALTDMICKKTGEKTPYKGILKSCRFKDVDIEEGLTR